MLWEITSLIVIIVYAYTILTTIIMLLMENRNPVKSIAWIVVLILLPIVGFIFYIFFGKNFRRQFVISRRSLQKVKRNTNAVCDINSIPEESLPAEYRNVASLALNSCDSDLYAHNDVKIYTDGKSMFDDILVALESAKHHIHMEYYIFLSDEIGSRVIDILIRKAKEGVSVRVIIDDVGSWMMKKSAVAEMEDAGIKVMSFLKVGLPFLSSRVNYRNHRKILIVDGLVGFTGGMNIADRYAKGLSWGPWRDTHSRIEGGAVSGLQKAFLSDWYFVNRKLLSDPVFYPKPEKKGSSLIQIISSGPDTTWDSIMQVYFMAIVQARKYVYIETPYFLPNESIITALQTAALSGTNVEMILPERSDAKITLIGSYSYLNEMFKAGVKVSFYKKGFIHSKVIVIDDMICTIGSANMDFRSFEQNFELNALIYDPEVAIKMKKIFNMDMLDSRRVYKDDWENRLIKQRLKESCARLFSPLL
ncbi:MAG: cardiolipin synthase [Paludibacteraceae bacterium]|nr:cardiolipin synthase [Paludibacteraceae bacterium]